ncbi:hypothetical protein HDU98_011781 [Podochytrium sp. JEL0797]|nr:hypothetical protein HDU98_011781 [Podochytrium sp. JEL0797]
MHLAQGQDCSGAASAFVFNPPALTYDSSVGGATFTVALTKQPHGMIRAAFKLPGLQMNTPIVSFSSENWATPQTVTITAHGGALGAAVNSIEVDIDAPCAVNIDRCTASYPFTHTDGGVNGDGGGSATCTVNGDPIFTTFEGQTYTFVGAGEFYYYKSPSVVVIGSQSPCIAGSPEYCINSVSVRYMDSIIAIGKIDDDTPKVKVISPNTNGLTCSQMVNQKATVTTANGISVSMDSLNWMATITVPTSNGGTGLCYGQGDNWMVPEEEDNIMGNYVPGSLSPFAQYLGQGVVMNVSPAIGFGPNDYTTCLANPAIAAPVLVPAGPIAIPVAPIAPLIDPGFNKNSADQQVIAPAGVPVAVAPAAVGATVPPVPVLPNALPVPVGGAPAALPNPVAPLPLAPLIAGAAPPATAPILAPIAVAPVADSNIPVPVAAAPAPPAYNAAVPVAAATLAVSPLAVAPLAVAPAASTAAAQVAAAPVAIPPLAVAPVASTAAAQVAVAPVAIPPVAPAPASPIAPAAPIVAVAAPAPVAPAVYQAPGSSSPNALKNLLANGATAVMGSHVALLILVWVL